MDGSMFDFGKASIDKVGRNMFKFSLGEILTAKCMATNHKLARVRDRLVGSHCDGKWIKRDSALFS
jgi:hypothetical protein